MCKDSDGFKDESLTRVLLYVVYYMVWNVKKTNLICRSVYMCVYMCFGQLHCDDNESYNNIYIYR